MISLEVGLSLEPDFEFLRGGLGGSANLLTSCVDEEGDSDLLDKLEGDCL
jgi:hypothetical protein